MTCSETPAVTATWYRKLQAQVEQLSLSGVRIDNYAQVGR